MGRIGSGGLGASIRAKIHRARVTYAFLRWESAVTLAAALVLTVLVPGPFAQAGAFWRWTTWPLLGLIAEALIWSSSMADRGLHARIVRETLGSTLDPTVIATTEYRAQFVEASAVQEQIEALLPSVGDRAMRAQLDQVATEFANWLGETYALAQQIDHTRRRPPGSTGDAAKQQQYLALAEERLRDTLGAMRAAFAQTQLVSASGKDSSRIQRLRQEIGDQIAGLIELFQELDDSSG